MNSQFVEIHDSDSDIDMEEAHKKFVCLTNKIFIENLFQMT